jgi:hypothetical protein
LNLIVEKKGLGPPTFKGFMVDGVQANKKVVCIVYGTGDHMVKWLIKSELVFIGNNLKTSKKCNTQGS